jgi:hypothetical protein
MNHAGRMTPTTASASSLTFCGRKYAMRFRRARTTNGAKHAVAIAFRQKASVTGSIS